MTGLHRETASATKEPVKTVARWALKSEQIPSCSFEKEPAMFIRALDPGVAQTHILFAVRAHCDAGNDPTTCLDE